VDFEDDEGVVQRFQLDDFVALSVIGTRLMLQLDQDLDEAGHLTPAHVYYRTYPTEDEAIVARWEFFEQLDARGG
jgi:hypothetical protein